MRGYIVHIGENSVVLSSEVFHEFMERIGQCVPDLAGYVRADRSGFGTAMPERVLNQTEMNTQFHQVCCIRRE
jgi:hypothetical protein